MGGYQSTKKYLISGALTLGLLGGLVSCKSPAKRIAKDKEGIAALTNVLLATGKFASKKDHDEVSLFYNQLGKGEIRSAGDVYRQMKVALTTFNKDLGDVTDMAKERRDKRGLWKYGKSIGKLQDKVNDLADSYRGSNRRHSAYYNDFFKKVYMPLIDELRTYREKQEASVTDRVDKNELTDAYKIEQAYEGAEKEYGRLLRRLRNHVNNVQHALHRHDRLAHRKDPDDPAKNYNDKKDAPHYTARQTYLNAVKAIMKNSDYTAIKKLTNIESAGRKYVKSLKKRIRPRRPR